MCYKGFGDWQNIPTFALQSINNCIMPKMKSNSGASKRFKKTASGKIKRKHAFKNHILTKKSKKRKLRLRHMAVVKDCDMVRVEAMLKS